MADEDLSSYLHFSRRLSRYSSALSQAAVAELHESSTSPLRAMLAFALVKAAKTHGAVQLLAREGFAEDAVVLVRSLFELTLDAHYATQDASGQRARRWVDYAAVTRYEMNRVMETDSVFLSKGDAVKARPDVMQEIEEKAREARVLGQNARLQRKPAAPGS